MKIGASVFISILVLVALSCKEDEEPRVNELTFGDQFFKLNKIDCTIFTGQGFAILGIHNFGKADQVSCEIQFWEIEGGRVYPTEKTYALNEDFTDNIMVIIDTSDGDHLGISGTVTVATRNGKSFCTFQDVVFKRVSDNTLWYGSAKLGCDY